MKTQLLSKFTLAVLIAAPSIVSVAFGHTETGA